MFIDVLGPNSPFRKKKDTIKPGDPNWVEPETGKNVTGAGGSRRQDPQGPNRYGGAAPVPFPIYGPDPSIQWPDMPRTDGAFASSQSDGMRPVSQQLPNLTQYGGYQSQTGDQNIRLNTPQLSRIYGGKEGLTPGEILNYLNERENQLRYAEDERRQVALDVQSQGMDRIRGSFNATQPFDKYQQHQGQLQNMLGQGKGEALKNLDKGFDLSLSYGDKGLADAYGSLDAGQGRVRSLLAGGEKNSLAEQDAGIGRLRGVIGSGKSEAYGNLDKGYSTAKGTIGKAYGYVGDLGKQAEFRADRAHKAGIAGSNANLASRGLSNSTVTMSTKLGHDRNLEDAKLGIDDMRARAYMGINERESNLDYSHGTNRASVGQAFNRDLQGAESAYTNNRTSIRGDFAKTGAASEQAYSANRANMGFTHGTNQAGMAAAYGNNRANMATQYNTAAANAHNNYMNNVFGTQMDLASQQRNAELAYSNARGNILLGGFGGDPNAGIAGGYAQAKTKTNLLGQLAGAAGGTFLGALTGGLGTAAAGGIANLFGMGQKQG